MSKEAKNHKTNDPTPQVSFRTSSVGIRSSFGIRHSTFRTVLNLPGHLLTRFDRIESLKDALLANLGPPARHQLSTICGNARTLRPSTSPLNGTDQVMPPSDSRQIHVFIS